MARKRKTKTVNLPAENALRVLNDEEQRLMVRMRKKLTSQQIIVFKDGLPAGKDEIAELLSHAVIMEICKSTSGNGAMQIVNNAAAGQYWNEMDTNLAVALAQMADLEPKTPLEAMLISQMVAVNSAIGKTMSRGMVEGQTFQWKEMNMNLATKLQRTFLAQIEALQKLRGKGQQTMRIEHVHVNAGGQAAIVGHVEHSGRGEGGNGKE